MNKYPNIRTLNGVLEDAEELIVNINGRWMPARAQVTMPTLANRFRAAWMVFTGKADALIWPGKQ